MKLIGSGRGWVVTPLKGVAVALVSGVPTGPDGVMEGRPDRSEYAWSLD